MNTNQLKRFAKEARLKLLDQVGRKLEFVIKQDTAELRGKEKEIEELKKRIKETSKEQVIEMVSYTWFNRLMALRFMDANGYTVPKVVTPPPDMTNPEILKNALGGNIESDLNLDKKRVNELLDGKTKVKDIHTEVYKMLLIASCNQWHTTMPFMFERINDYTELLLPDDLLSEYSIVTDIRNGMSDEDCKQEELIGWLYQFYISDKKDHVFEKLKRNVKITAENIPAATQLFTPHWIVRYMVENTLGKLWMTIRPDSKLREFMPYYIESPEGNAPVPVPDDLTNNTEQLLTKITFLDPCQGSGHVLVYAFELFTKIYDEEGFNTNEIPELILKNNLFGIDIDERAAQLAAFALTMKARSYYSRFLRKPVQPNVIALEKVREDIIRRSMKLPIKIKGRKINNYSELSLHLLTQADNFGSLIQIDPEEVEHINVDVGEIWQEEQEKFKEQAIYLSRKYHCVVTNPPYMGAKGMNGSIKNFVSEKYSRSKSDMMACFMERCLDFNFRNGKTGMINQHSWMFLSSYDELRSFILDNFQFESMLHLGPRAFPEIGGEVVQNTTFVLGKYKPINNCDFIRLTEYENTHIKDEKTIEAIRNPNCEWHFYISQKDFEKIPGRIIGYWAKGIRNFEGDKLNKYYESGGRNKTHNNNKYVRFFWEINFNDDSWLLYTNGGDFRKYYGNEIHVVNWSTEARNEYESHGGLSNPKFWNKEGITWNLIGSTNDSFRLKPSHAQYSSGSPTIFNKQFKLDKLVLAYLNSPVAKYYLKILNPTLNTTVGDVISLPFKTFKNQDLEILVENTISICKNDWDSHELSKDFQQNELVLQESKFIKESFDLYKTNWTAKYFEIHKNEEELNRKFLDVYGLQDELSPEVLLEEITILQEEVKIVDNELFIDPVPVLIQFISYNIGCIFGRYSLDKTGLILANQGETLKDFLKKIPKPSFTPDEDNVIPVLDYEWFTDDIVGRFKVFLKAAFGEEHFEENLKFIEDTIGKDIRKYFVKDYYNDHIKRYKKRPIYWMFSSPKGNFRALIYMHRYQPDLCSKILNDYLRTFIKKLEAKKDFDTKQTISADISANDKLKAQKEIDKLEVMLKDCREYEKTLHEIATRRISMDLDDGVKVNYQKFKNVLVPIKGLDKEEE